MFEQYIVSGSNTDLKRLKQNLWNNWKLKSSFQGTQLLYIEIPNSSFRSFQQECNYLGLRYERF